MGRFTHESRVLPVQNAGQHLHSLQWDHFPMARKCSNPRKDVRRETGAEFALYNPDLRRIDYNQINKPTFL
jgi:hypothetical protein